MVYMQNDIFIVFDKFFPCNKNNMAEKLKMLDSKVTEVIALKTRYKKSPQQKLGA